METNVGNGRVVTVRVPASVAGNLEGMQKVTKAVLGRLGCSPCHSGFDLRFIQESDFFVDPGLNVHAFGGAE